VSRLSATSEELDAGGGDHASIPGGGESGRSWCSHLDLRLEHPVEQGAMSGSFPVVVLVCSSGGLDALSRVLGPLPAELPAAVVVLQHLDPERASQLAEILDERSALPVAVAVDGDSLLPGRVLVAPPGRHTLLTSEGVIALIPSGQLPPYRPSADLLLVTAATALGPRLIVAVLSGRGNDAATGASAARRFGGTVIATDLATSTESAMPQATITRMDAIDHVLALDDVPALLVALSSVPRLGQALL
jgi:two-component system, chemotaxis family, protein-glutamate methylesterase/glutaminase